MRFLISLLFALHLLPTVSYAASPAARACEEGHTTCARACPRNSPQFAPCMQGCARQKLECATLAAPQAPVATAPAPDTPRRGPKADSAATSRMMYSGACKAQADSCLAGCNVEQTRPDSKEGYSATACARKCKVEQAKCGIEAANAAP